MTNTYQLIIEYDGSNYVGWQKQKNGKSIQGVIENILKKIFKKKILLYGSGRTDSGVHAYAQSAHFSTKIDIKNNSKIINTFNYFLRNHSISIIKIKKRANNFHARHSAKRRVYKYLILNRIGNPIIQKKKVWLIKQKLNLDKMKKACKLLEGTKDFSTFRSSSCNANSPIRTINKVTIKKLNDLIEIRFISKSFLKQQVRSMVGCLKRVGDGTWSDLYFKKVINSRNRSECASIAPPEGLYLEKVYY